MEERHIDSMVCTLVTKWDSFPVPVRTSRGLLSCEVLVLSLFVRMDLKKWVGRWRENGTVGFPLNGVYFRTNMCCAIHRSSCCKRLVEGLPPALAWPWAYGWGWQMCARLQGRAGGRQLALLWGCQGYLLLAPAWVLGCTRGGQKYLPHPASSCSACFICTVPFLPPLPPL